MCILSFELADDIAQLKWREKKKLHDFSSIIDDGDTQIFTHRNLTKEKKKNIESNNSCIQKSNHDLFYSLVLLLFISLAELDRIRQNGKTENGKFDVDRIKDLTLLCYAISFTH